MSNGTRLFAGPDGLLINATLDLDDEQRPALTLIGWFTDRTRVEVTYSWGDTSHHHGLPVEVWCETLLHLLTPDQATAIVRTALYLPTPVVVTRRHRP